MSTDHIPISIAARCVGRVLEFKDIESWAEVCLDAVTREGAGPMIEAARIYMPLGHHPEVRNVMRAAADARIELLRFLRRI